MCWRVHWSLCICLESKLDLPANKWQEYRKTSTRQKMARISWWRKGHWVGLYSWKQQLERCTLALEEQELHAVIERGTLRSPRSLIQHIYITETIFVARREVTSAITLVMPISLFSFQLRQKKKVFPSCTHNASWRWNIGKQACNFLCLKPSKRHRSPSLCFLCPTSFFLLLLWFLNCGFP